MNRIICVEGLSGAGKSTLCQAISLSLRQAQTAHRWLRYQPVEQAGTFPTF